MHLLYMTNHNNTFENDEVDLRELILTLWRGKVFIFFVSTFFILLASYYLHNSERKYLVEFKLKPVGQTDNTAASTSIFASFAGLDMQSSSTNDFIIYKELISSIEVSEIIFKNKALIKSIFNHEWNPSLNNFSEPSKSKSQAYIDDLKKIITGNDQINYIPPNAQRLAIYISRNIQIVEDKITGFITLKSETSNPDMLLSIITTVVEATDQIMRQRFINFSKEPIKYYKKKLGTSRSREHREALAELISKEEQKLMLASKSKYFVAEPYIAPKISLYPVAPKPKLILAVSLVLGLSFGATLVLIRHAYKKEN